MTDFVRPGHAEMAASVRALLAPSRELEGILFRARHEQEGDVWSDLFGEDDVWHRRDPQDRGAWDSPPRVTESFDLAMEEKIAGVRLVALRELLPTDVSRTDPEWRAWTCEVAAHVFPRTFEGKGFNPACALLDALFQLYAFLDDEDGVRTGAQA
jgi:hypothetical protein